MLENNKVKFGVVLGSGLDTIADLFTEKKIVSEKSPGIHKRRVYEVRDSGSSTMLFCGRSHFYEGFTAEEITSNITEAKSRGIEYLLITNAAGGINVNFEESDFMLINSHINLNSKLLYDKKQINYDEKLRNLFTKVCSDLKIKLHNGVYASLSGPAYETNAEIKFLKKTGADAVGMSTIPEVFEASKSGIKVIGLSVITNLLRENSSTVINHKAVLKTSKCASEKLFFAVKRLANELK